MIEAELQSQVLNLYFNEKKSIRRIAIIVGVDRKTVRRIIDRKQIRLERLSVQKITLINDFKEQIKDLVLKDPKIASSTILHRIRQCKKASIPSGEHPKMDLVLG